MSERLKRVRFSFGAEMDEKAKTRPDFVPKSRLVPKWFFIMMMLSGVFSIVVGGWFIVDDISFGRVALETEGEILKVWRSGNPDDGPDRIDVRFYVDGVEYVVNMSGSGTVGQKIKILYDPLNPHHAKLPGNLWGGLLAIALGVGTMVFFAVLYTR